MDTGTISATERPEEKAVAPSRRPWLPAALGMVIFVLCLSLYGANNRFPLRYHPDEPLKVEMAMTGEDHFLHPLLMLVPSRLIHVATGRSNDDQRVVVIGRWVSAVFAALAVVGLMAAAGLRRGVAGAVCVGLLAAFCPSLLIYAHYMKEDASLLFGLSCVLLSTAWYLRYPSRWGPALVGVAAGLAISGKYIGIAALPLAVGAVLWRTPRNPNDRRWKRAAFFFGSFLGIVLLVNFPALIEMDKFRHGLGFEIGHVLTSHFGLTTNRFDFFYVQLLWNDVRPPIFLLAVGWTLAVLKGWPRRGAQDRIMALFPFGYLLVLYLSPLQGSRYLLPVTVLLHYSAGMALVELAERIPAPRRVRLGVGALLLVGIVAFQGVRCVDCARQFGDDSRTRFEQWFSENATPEDMVVQDDYVALPSQLYLHRAQRTIELRLHTEQFTGSFGSLEAARRFGATHVAVCDLTYWRFFDPRKFPLPEAEAQHRACRTFYEELFRDGELLWENAPENSLNAFTNPTVKYYRIVP